MRLQLIRFALLVGALLMPASVYGGDSAIAKQLTSVLQEAKKDGDLSGFKLSVKVEDGTVWMSGNVADVGQRELALDKARRVSGVKLVVNDIEIADEFAATPTPAPTPAAAQAAVVDSGITRASAQRSVRYRDDMDYDYAVRPTRNRRAVREVEVAPPVPVSRPNRRISSSRPARRPSRRPASPTRGRRVQFEQDLGGSGSRNFDSVGAGAFSGGFDGGYVGDVYDSYGGGFDSYAGDGYVGDSYAGESYGGSFSGGSTYQLEQPISSGGGYGGGYDGGSGGYENPQLPGYSWPSFAAHPNYAGVSYPKQYSAAAWPYIGPFYPYPQVPLGWRKVSLEWDDGWWMLDFKSK